MGAGAHRGRRIITRRQRAVEQAETFGKLPSMRQRMRWAGSLEQLVAGAYRYYLYWQYAPPFQARVVRACGPALLAIAGVLRDHRQPVSRAAMGALKTFITDGRASALFYDDPDAARRAAEQLCRSFTGHPEPR